MKKMQHNYEIKSLFQVYALLIHLNIIYLGKKLVKVILLK